MAMALLLTATSIGSPAAAYRASILFSRASSTPTAKRKGSEGLLLFATRRLGSLSASASRRWGCAAFPRPRSFLRTWPYRPTRWYCHRMACAGGFADLMNAYNGQRIGAATVALGLAEGAY